MRAKHDVREFLHQELKRSYFKNWGNILYKQLGETLIFEGFTRFNCRHVHPARNADVRDLLNEKQERLPVLVVNSAVVMAYLRSLR